MTQMTVGMLVRAGACPTGVSMFRYVFGEETDLTEEAIEKAIDYDLDRYAYFLASAFLSKEGFRKWAIREHEVEHVFVGGSCEGCAKALRIFVEIMESEHSEKLPGV